MRCPSLDELPPPPLGRTGWPWTEETPRFEDANAPKISIVTPSYMQAGFLEETIRSVLLQGYPTLEYFVLDAGSTDGTVEVIRKYEQWLTGWRSERDRGQSAAVNEGWAKATGELVAWINSDDWYQPGAFAAVAKAALGNPGATWFAGHVDDHTVDGAFIKRHPARHMPLDELLGKHRYGFHQPGMFWRASHLREVGALDEALHNSFDCELWARSVSTGHKLEALDLPVACFRRHRQSKTGGNATRMLAEDRAVFDRYAAKLDSAKRERAENWLRDYEADRILTSVYQLLNSGRRAQALQQLLRHVHLLPRLRPPKLFFGALLRITTGRGPAPWFLEKAR
jgi:glycosyltransferase involved in cell wall biosynthesis